MTDDLKKLAEKVEAAEGVTAHVARLNLHSACTPDAILALIRERDEARAELALYQGDPAGITKVPDHIAEHAKGIGKLLLAEKARAEAAEAALSAAREEVERYKIALADATRRPMGVLPLSAEGLITAADMDAAEKRRPKYATLTKEPTDG